MIILKKIVVNFSLIIIFFLLFSIPCKASDYYVSTTTGNDNNPGTTQSLPWKTITKATATISNSNHTVNVAEGTYTENVKISQSGSAPGYLYFLANGLVQINGKVLLTGNYIKFEGFTVTASSASYTFRSSGMYNYFKSCTSKDSMADWGGFLLDEYSDHNTIESCHTYKEHNSGISIAGTNHTIVNNNIERMQIGLSPSGDCNGMNFNGSGHLIKGNYIHDFRWPDETGLIAHIDGMQADHNTSTPNYGAIAPQNVIIEDNHIFIGNDLAGSLIPKTDVEGPHCWMITGYSTRNATNLTFRNNICESHSGFNEGAQGREPGVTVLTNFKFYNNTFVSDLSFTPDSTGGWPNGISTGYVSGFEIFNNIFVDARQGGISVSLNSSYTAGNNLFWNSDGSTAALGDRYTLHTGDKRSVSGGTIYDPKFVSNTRNLAVNRKLQAGSPAIDAGIALASVTNDFAGTSRPQGAEYDIGAYEYVSGGITPTVTPPFTHCTPLGDIDCSGKVNILDLSSLLSAFGSTTNKLADLNDSGKVNMIDLSILLSNFGK